MLTARTATLAKYSIRFLSLIEMVMLSLSLGPGWLMYKYSQRIKKGNLYGEPEVLFEILAVPLGFAFLVWMSHILYGFMGLYYFLMQGLFLACVLLKYCLGLEVEIYERKHPRLWDYEDDV